MGSRNGKPVLRKQDIDDLVATSKMTRQQVKDAFSHFITENPDGKISHKAFCEMLQTALVGVDADKMECHVFRIYDVNNDGYIDFVEFMVVYSIMAGGSPREILGKIFRLFDENSDGAITREEMERLVSDMYGLLKRKNPNCLAVELIKSSVFTEMDSDRDGLVTKEEFITACLAEQDFSKLLSSAALDIFFEDEKEEQERRRKFVPAITDNQIVQLVEAADKSEEDIREAFEAFTGNFPDGKITPAVFREIIPTIVSPEDAGQVQTMEKHIFRFTPYCNDGKYRELIYDNFPGCSIQITTVTLILWSTWCSSQS